MRTPPTGATACTKYFAKNISESIYKGVGAHPTTHAAHAGSVGIDPGVPKTIIGSTLFIVIEDFIGLFDLFEIIFSLFVVRIADRVIFHRQKAIGPSYVIIASTFFQTLYDLFKSSLYLY